MADILNRFLGRTDINSVKLRTLSDSISRIGAEISKELSNVTAHILSMYGFDGESGLPLEGMVLSDNITAAAVAQVAEQGKPEINEGIAAVNDSRKEGGCHHMLCAKGKNLASGIPAILSKKQAIWPWHSGRNTMEWPGPPMEAGRLPPCR